MRRRAFTLIELLVVIAVIALLISILLPAMSGARRSALAVKCLSNIRSLEQAHVLYYDDHRERFVDVGMPHGGSSHEEVAWLNTLSDYFGTTLVVRSPADKSPHWPTEDGGAGVPVPGTKGKFRRTSYGINNWTSRFAAPFDSNQYDALPKIPTPHATVHFLVIAFHGQYAGADHTHAENWGEPPDAAALASAQVELALFGGSTKSGSGKSNYGFLDGHAGTHTFSEVYDGTVRNRFDPGVAH